VTIWKTVTDAVQKKKAELERKAAERATDIALERAKAAAIGAALSAKKSIEQALFGDEEPSSSKPASSRKPTKRSPPPASFRPRPPPEPPRRKPEDDRVAAIARAEAQLDKDVDADLAALKQKLSKK